jgi:hypothetical protein
VGRGDWFSKAGSTGSLATDPCLDQGLEFDLSLTGDLLLALELAVLASWTDCLASLAGRLTRPVELDEAADTPPCNVRDADAEPPRGECCDDAEFGLDALGATTEGCITERPLES